MTYSIRFVDDDHLPAGHDFVLVEREGEVMVALRESAVGPSLLENAWAAYRAVCVVGRSLVTA